MVIPVHDVLPVRRTPWLTYLLIGANVIIFLLSPASRSTGFETVTVSQLCEQEAFFDRYAAIPVELMHDDPLDRVATGEAGVGPNGPGCVIAPPQYEKRPWLSVLYSMFLHGGWLHLLGNMLFLWVFGNNVEDRMGRVRFALFYLACGYAASYAFAALNAGSADPLVGASGAISGVLGAYLVLYPRAKVWSLVPFLFFIPIRLPAWIVLGMWFVIQWLYSAGAGISGAGSVAYLAHVSGFVVGALLALPLRGRSRTPPPTRYMRARWPGPGVDYR